MTDSDPHPEIPLNHKWAYTGVDRRFWKEHLEDWLPPKIIDAHVHVGSDKFRLFPMTDEMRKYIWVNEVASACDVETTDHCIATTFPGREVRCLTLGHPSLDYDIEKLDAYIREACHTRPWLNLAVTRPCWSAEKVAKLLSEPNVIGIKPYYTLIDRSEETRDTYLEAGIFDFLPHHQLEVINERGGWITLHVPKADRLGHPDNIREIIEIREKYPRIKLIIAHLGRSYTLPHAREGLLPLVDDDGLYFDNSAVLNPDVHRFALETIGPDRILYGTDNPIFYMRGRRQWEGKRYINRTSYPFYFNKERESPEIESRYTLYMYEALKAIKDSCEELGLTRRDVENLFYGNADRLMREVLAEKNDN